MIAAVRTEMWRPKNYVMNALKIFHLINFHKIEVSSVKSAVFWIFQWIFIFSFYVISFGLAPVGDVFDVPVCIAPIFCYVMWWNSYICIKRDFCAQIPIGLTPLNPILFNILCYVFFCPFVLLNSFPNILLAEVKSWLVCVHTHYIFTIKTISLLLK